MRRRIIGFGVLLAVGGHLAGDVQRDREYTPVAEAYTAEAAQKPFREGCGPKPVAVKDFVSFTKRRYRGYDLLTRREKRRATHMSDCLATHEKRQASRRWRDGWQDDLLFRRAERRITGGNYCNWSATSGWSVIPCGVVECESHGLWSAYNDSGAAGRYQLMPEHGRSWPVLIYRADGSLREEITEAHILEHHRIARSLGTGDWTCGY